MNEPHKNTPTSILKQNRTDFERLRESLNWVSSESDRLSAVAQTELALARRELRIKVEVIDAELNLRRARGIGTAPLVLPDLQDAPSAMAS